VTLAASIDLLTFAIAIYVAALARQLSRAPGWQEQRYFAFAALTGGLYAILSITTSAPLGSDEVMVLCSRGQLAAAALHSAFWIRYTSTLLGRQPSRFDDQLVRALKAIAAVSVLTPWFLPGGVQFHTFAELGMTYRTADPSAAGSVAYFVALGSLLVPTARLGAAARHGVPHAAVQFGALLTLVLLGVNDTFVVEGLYSAPYLLDLGFLFPAAAVGYGLTTRFVEDAREHQALRADLERKVDERTAELGRAQEALHRAEKLAALGQFAAGVAHEVNNPAAVVTANLHYLAETERDALGEQAQEAVSESLVAMQRIGTIVRQLLDSGRIAASSEARTAVSPRALADAAASVARARFGRRVVVLNRVPDGLWALAPEGVLGQVIVNLVVNAVQAIPERRTDGHVIVRGERAGERVRVVVEDNGSGMEEEVLRRVFEPFFTTKPFGTGTGLGLAVSRGLVTGLGGDLRLESAVGSGTKAIVELPAAERAPDALPAPVETPSRRRLRMLIVDDEAAVLSSMRRVLDTRYGVDLASNVDEGLERIRARAYDVVLCDVMMPAGGGERLYRTLLGQSPALARRVVFFTGGAITEAARHFLRSQPQPILSKPLDLDQLAEVAERFASPDGMIR
jgi:signal transduction histidine kinase/ActR/RegA family two-component response regulator